MNKQSLAALIAVAVLAGTIGALVAQPVSAVPETLRFSYVEAVARSSTRIPLVADQRGSGQAFMVSAQRTPAIRVLGNADTVFGSGGAAVFDGAIVVPRGSISSALAGQLPAFATATASVTPTPTPTNTPTITPSPTP